MLALSECLTLVVSCHWSHSRTLTHRFTTYIVSHLHPSVPSQGRSIRRVALLPPHARLVVLATRINAAIRGCLSRLDASCRK